MKVQNSFLVFVCLLAGCGGSPTPQRVPTASFSANNLTFGSENVGSSSEPFPVTLTNSGTAALTISQITVSQNFSQTSDCGTSVAPQGSCTINVTLTPTAEGTLTGTLSVSDNAPLSPQSVTLSGTGLPVSSGGRCTGRGMECPPQWPPCCPGLVCAAASVRAFCEPASASSSEVMELLQRDQNALRERLLDLDRPRREPSR